MKRKIILASRSPRRKQLLEQIGLKFEVRESDYDEDMAALPDPYKLVKFLALKKTEDVARHYKNAVIIGADTFIVFENKFLGKPKSKAEAGAMLKKLSGKEHSVVTGFAIIDTKSGKVINDYDEARVKFRRLDQAEIDSYLKTGHALDRAGAYGVQDQSAIFIEKISGSYYIILGLPITKIYQALKKLGVKVF